MEGIQKVKMDFPLVKTISRDKLIEWFRDTMSPKLHTIKELGTGADFCIGLEILFPGCVGKHRIKFDNPSVYDRRQNFKLLQSAFNSLKLNKDVPIERLEEGNYRETYYFALWFKAFFEANYKGTAKGLQKCQVSACQIKNSMRNTAGGGYRQMAGCWPPKDVPDGRCSVELLTSMNSEKDTSETKSSPEMKRKMPLISHRIINPRMQSDQSGHKFSRRNETLQQQKNKALSKQTEELGKAVNDLSECKKVFEESKVYFEKRDDNIQQLKVDLDKEPLDSSTHPNTPEPVKMSDCLEEIKEEDGDEAKSNEQMGMKKADLERELAEINQIVREQRRVITELEQQKESKGEQITTLESIVCELTQAIKEMETVRQNQARQIQDLQESASEQKKSVDDMEQIMNEQLKSLEDLTQTNAEYSKKIEEMEQANNDMALDNTMLTKSNKAMAVHIEDLEQNYRELTQQNDNLTKCNQELACHYSDLSNENREVHQRNKRLAKNYETILCYSCLDANLYFKQLVKVEKACKREPNSSLRKCINTILNQTKYHPPLAPGSGSRKEQR